MEIRFAPVETLAAELRGARVLVISGPSRRGVAAFEGASVFDQARVHVPAEVVERAASALAASGADTIVAVGGGSAIGLGKALRVDHPVRFIAVPTTYAGSERTATYGITRDREKVTARDERVRPDLIVYDVALARETPIALTAQSLLNAFAHVASTGEELAAGHDVLRALEDLLQHPRAMVAREAAARAASACAVAIDRGKTGAQHGLAHLLGGALGLEHAALHAALLPQFLAWLRASSPERLDALEVACDRRDLDAYVWELLVRAGAPVSIAASRADVSGVLARRPELPGAIALDACDGLRPPGRGGRMTLGGVEVLVHGVLSAPRVLIVRDPDGTHAPRWREILPDACVLGARGDVEAARAALDRDASVVGPPPTAALDRLRARGPIARGLPLGTIESEALAGTIPPRQNTPRRAPYGLYPEQLNGTGFTAPRAANRRTWCYRVRPSAQRRASVAIAQPRLAARFDGAPVLDLVGFAPLALPDEAIDFVDGLVTLCGAGDASLRRGFAFHRYAATRSMDDRAFYSADGDLLILPELGALTLLTELGPLEVAPGALAVIPRGIVFSVLLDDAHARGYVAEPFGRGFALPERGPIGANGTVDPRHLRAPHAWFEDRFAPGFRVVGKLGGALHEATQDHSPFDVVAWHGNHAPFVYDLADFSPVGNTAFDHGDPSVFTVLSAPLDEPGAHALDLVVFPERWDTTAHTFRPPFFHRNGVAELNGIVRDPGRGAFRPGCAFLTPPFTGHGVSGRAVEHARALTDEAADAPSHRTGSLWFQLETALAPSLTPWAAPLDDWAATWGSHRSYFEP